MKIEIILLAKLCLLAALACPFTSSLNAIGINDVWINEIHYDNAGGDENEFIEIAGDANQNLNGLHIELYNGDSGAKYGSTISLNGKLPDNGTGFGFAIFDRFDFGVNGIQNGPPDGVALIFDLNLYDTVTPMVLQFLSYEGSFTATSGLAKDSESDDILVNESGSTAIGNSLQLIGSGNKYSDFSWAADLVDTPAASNRGQTFGIPDNGTTFGLLSLGFAMLCTLKRRQR